ncbi:hypothetical protein M0R45_025918 [Rubus argutus]|uniref:Uncharacterized protein n=1 Tax=Rubus argutus TaxID=59490 RepID=A0AAW1WYI7_RUBAR
MKPRHYSLPSNQPKTAVRFTDGTAIFFTVASPTKGRSTSTDHAAKKPSTVAPSSSQPVDLCQDQPVVTQSSSSISHQPRGFSSAHELLCRRRFPEPNAPSSPRTQPPRATSLTPPPAILPAPLIPAQSVSSPATSAIIDRATAANAANAAKAAICKSQSTMLLHPASSSARPHQ